MIFLSLYRASFYVMLLLATLTMSVDTTDNKIGMLYPAAVAVAAVLAYLSVDRNPAMSLPRPLANLLALGSVALVMFEYLMEPNEILTALSHFLVYLVLIKLFLPKTPEDDWTLFGLGMVQVSIGAVIGQADHVGLVLFAWAFTALWVLSLFSLHREALRYRNLSTPEGAAVLPLYEPYAEEPYPGLLDLPYIVSALKVLGLTLALGGAIFLVMPRRTVVGRSPLSSQPIAQHLTGFDEEVQLGQLGEILENDSVVMSIELFDEDNVRTRLEGEPLWRGITMSQYAKGRWHKERKRLVSMPLRRPATPLIRQRIKLEATDSPVLFALRPMMDISAGGREADMLNSFDGSIAREESNRPGTFDYEVVSALDPMMPQPGEAPPISQRSLQQLVEVPEPLRTRLRGIALPIIERIPADQITERARALESYLRDSGQFGYSLRMQVVDPKLDPVEDFLVNRHEGHCEYFASALALLLRSVGIRARLVNGFKGGDWNDLARVLSVRQKHAHSWVEAYLGQDDEHMARWLTLDPTPATERRQSIEQVGGIASNFRQLTDLVRYIWVFFIVGYNSDRQYRLIYGPVTALIEEAKRGFAMMRQAVQPMIRSLFNLHGDFISWRGFVVSFVLLLMLVALVRGGYWLITRMWRWYRGPVRDESSLSAGVAFYRRLTLMLQEYGLERPPAETHYEFARRASVFLTGRGSGTESTVDVPRLVVDAFYRVRFGHLALSPATLSDLESRLDVLEESLRSTQG